MDKRKGRYKKMDVVNTTISKDFSQRKPLYQENPADDGVLRILMLGNSFCYYFTQELHGMLQADGIKAEVVNLYKTGCYLHEHWEWLHNGNPRYELFITDENGREKLAPYTIEEAIRLRNWDVISLQQHYSPKVASALETAIESCEPYAKDLFDILKDYFPQTRLLWHHTWAYQVGYEGPYGKDPATVEPDNKVLTVEKQTVCYENIRASALKICEENNVERIPSGDAWQIARANPEVGDVLCNKKTTDFYHDGTTGGGRFLNANVWYEIITGKSCLDNPYRPETYRLSEERVAALKAAAHEAVAQMSQA